MESGGAFMAKIKSLEYWKQVIQDCTSSDLSEREWCKENDIKHTTYRYWLTKVRNQEKGATTQPVWAEITYPQPQIDTSNKSSRINIRYRDFLLEIENNSDMDLVVKVLKTLCSIC